jgi:hypothetical protein
MINVALTEETVDGIVITELKSFYSVLAEVSDDWYAKEEDKQKDRLCQYAIINVLSHYLTSEEHKKWLLTLERTQK